MLPRWYTMYEDLHHRPGKIGERTGWWSGILDELWRGTLLLHVYPRQDTREYGGWWRCFGLCI